MNKMKEVENDLSFCLFCHIFRSLHYCMPIFAIFTFLLFPLIISSESQFGFGGLSDS